MFVAVYDGNYDGADGFENYVIDASNKEEAMALLEKELAQSKSPLLAKIMLREMTVTRVGRVFRIVTEDEQVEA